MRLPAECFLFQLFVLFSFCFAETFEFFSRENKTERRTLQNNNRQTIYLRAYIATAGTA